MLKRRYRSKRIYWVLIVYVTIGMTNAVCDNDNSCLTSITTTSLATKSHFSFHPSSELSFDTFSDFHEAKVAKPRKNQNNPETVVNSIQEPTTMINDDNNNNNNNQGSIETDNDNDTRSLPGLSNIETGILGVCGILVVAGIAVGIFVWKNTARMRNFRQNNELTVEEEGHGGDFDYIKRLDTKQAINVPLPAIYRDDFFSNWQRRKNSNLQYEPKQKSPIRKVISEKQPFDNNKFQVPGFDHTIFNSEQEAVVVLNNKKIPLNLTADDDEEEEKEVDDDYIITAKHLRNSNYGPMFHVVSESPQANITTRPSALDPTYDPTALTYQLQKFLKSTPTPLIESNSPMQISINLNKEEEQEDMVHINLNEPDENTKTTLSNLQKAYQGLEQERKAIYIKENPIEKGPAQLFIQDYKHDYIKKNGKSFMSSLDLPDNEYIPLRNASGPELISRAKVLADPILRLGQDEIALWEQGRIKKELKRLSYEMWDEQVLREKIEEHDRKHIECYYGKFI